MSGSERSYEALQGSLHALRVELEETKVEKEACMEQVKRRIGRRNGRDLTLTLTLN